MKIFLLSLLLFIGSTFIAHAQDTITKTDGEAIKARVLEITLGEVKYKKFDNQEGPTYVLPKADVLLIEYENKTTEVFPKESYAAAASTSNSTSLDDRNINSFENLFTKGQRDASVHYRDYKSAGTGTLVATLFTPLGGLITAIACASSTPKPHNLGYPDQNLMQDHNYTMGYSQEAKRVKSGKVWRNFGIGIGVNLAVILLLVSQQ